MGVVKIVAAAAVIYKTKCPAIIYKTKCPVK
jgi:hypothetical protein